MSEFLMQCNCFLFFLIEVLLTYNVTCNVVFKEFIIKLLVFHV